MNVSAPLNKVALDFNQIERETFDSSSFMTCNC